MGGIVALLALGLLILADRNGWLLVREADDMPAYHGRLARVVRVIDGDTLEVALGDALNDNAPTTRVRLWGIDCPEMPHFDQVEEPLAREATDAALALVQEQEVRLFLEPQRPRDSYGRVLAHVESSDGRSLNEALLEAGLARADDRWPHTRLTRYAQVELAAKRAKVGLWRDGP
jgi:endonuclease YncB( thermonuclease family)